VISKENSSSIGANSVRHPSSHRVQKVATKFFGPKLVHAYNQNNEIANVQHIETSTYNYGVPLQQQQQHQHQQQQRMRQRASEQQQSSSHANTNNIIVACADIYVYARKRPKLLCESKYADSIVVGDESKSEINSICNRQTSTSQICINEMKNAVDGTPVLRKVKNRKSFNLK
jgi:hypothetical protein